MRKFILFLLSLCSLSCAQSANQKEPLCLPQLKPQMKITGLNLNSLYSDYIVSFQKVHSLQPSGQPLREYNVKSIQLKKLNDKTFTFKMPISEIEQTLQKLSEIGEIEFLEPDFEVQATQVKTSSFNQAQWAHHLIQSEQAWAKSNGAHHLVVAVVDSGIDYQHIDLKNIIWKNSLEIMNGLDDDRNGYVDDIRGWNFVEKNNDPKTNVNSNHGTHVAGIIGSQGNTSSSVKGETQHVRLLPLRFISETGTGSTSNAIRAIDYAIQKKVFAINNSWGSFNRSEALSQAISRAEKAGILFLAAAGNDGINLSQMPFYPASFPHSNLISVAATQANDQLTSFSNYSRELVDVAAPGSQILSTVTGNRYMKMSGTSMATPFVAGLAVLVKAANQNLNFLQIKSIIQSSVDQKAGLFNKVKSSGRINAKKAVDLALQYETLCN